MKTTKGKQTRTAEQKRNESDESNRDIDAEETQIEETTHSGEETKKTGN